MNRQDKKKATGLKILAAAKQLFSDNGYEATSTRQIATAAGVGTGTVCAHFKDKHELTKCLFFSELEQRLANVTVDTSQGGLVFFEQQTWQFYQFYATDRAMARAFLQQAMFEFEFFEHQLGEFITRIAELLQLELPRCDEQQRLSLAKAWMGIYFIQLLAGLSKADSQVEQWHDDLMVECRALLKMAQREL